jgi:hypothetical protein
MAYKNAYKFSDAAFPQFARVEKVKLSLDPPTQTEMQPQSVKRILVLEPLVEAKLINIGDYLIAIFRLLLFWMRLNDSIPIYYKFHPDQQASSSKRLILELFKSFRSLSLLELSSDSVLEEIALQPRSEFYAIASSVLYYSKFLGSSGYSFYNLVPNNSSLDNYFKKQPADFLNALDFVDSS